MPDLEYQSEVEQVRESLDRVEAEEDITIDVSDEAISKVITDYVDSRIDPEKAVRYTTSDILDKANIENKGQYLQSSGSRQVASGGTNEKLGAGEINETDRWIEFEGVVIETYDTSVDSIAQQGRLADHTGSIRFTIWKSSNVDHEFEVGQTLNLEPVVTNEFQGEYEIKVENVTQIEEKTGDEALDIDPDEFTESVSGALIDFQPQMGLIDRCPGPDSDCNRVLQQNDECPDCGDVTSEIDLRTKAILDSGEDNWTIFLDEDQTSQLVNVQNEDGDIVPLTIEEAKNLAQNHGDRSVVSTIIEGNLHGEYVHITGRDRGDRFDVETIQLVDPPTIGEVEEIKEEMMELP